MADLIITGHSDLVAIADAVRSKGGASGQMTLGQIVSGINNIETEPVLQDKTVTPIKSSQTVKADSGYDGLGTVTVNKIPDNYIVPNGEITITENGTYDVASYASAVVNVESVGEVLDPAEEVSF